MYRRLVCVLAAGLLAAGTVLSAGGAASAALAAARQPDCNETGATVSVTQGSVNYYMGTPRNLKPGAAAILKPTPNSTAQWTFCVLFAGNTQTFIFIQNGLALTSRASSPGADVTMEPAGNGGNGFASQQWTDLCCENLFQNVKTGLYLRIRNGGPVMGQTLTTGSTPTSWQVP